MKSKRIARVTRLVTVAAVLSAPQLYGQEAGDSPANSSAFLDEIIVTAAKRAVRIESVPASVLVVDGDSLTRSAINSMEELSVHTPNLLVGDDAVTTLVTVRGVGSQPERSFEQSVALYVDDVYMPRSRQYRAPFLDVQRVQILRGPQAVVFGLNATAGAIGVYSNRSKPGDRAFADVSADYEFEYGGTRLTAIAGGTLTDTLAMRIALRYREAGDYYTNDFDGRSEGGENEKNARISAVWQPSQNSTFDVSWQHAEFSYDGDNGEQFGSPQLSRIALLGLPGLDDGVPNWRRNIDQSHYPTVTQSYGGLQGPGLDQTQDDLSVRAKFDLGEHELTAILANSNLEWVSYEDLDGGPLAIFTSGALEDFEQTSLEINLVSPLNRTIDYSVGIYAHKNKLHNDKPSILEPTFSVAPGAYGFDEIYLNSSFTTKSDVASLFGMATWNISDTFHLTGGLRYVDEKKSHVRDGQCLPVRNGLIDYDPSAADREIIEANAASFVCPTLVGFTGSRNPTHWMSEVTAQWDSSDVTMWYAKYSESVKSGGYGTSFVVAPGTLEYEDEMSHGFEVGGRSSIDDGRIRLNIALFDTRFEDLQLNAFNSVTAESFITNAASARSRGVEIDANWSVSSEFVLRGAVAWLDAKYDSFPDAPCPISLVLAGEVPPCNATGKTMPRAPKVSASIGLDFDHSMTPGTRILAGLNLGYRDDHIVDAALEPTFVQEAYTIVDARVGMSAADETWNVSLVGRNLTNEAVINGVLPFLTNIGYMQAPRRLWLQFTWRFGRN